MIVVVTCTLHLSSRKKQIILEDMLNSTLYILHYFSTFIFYLDAYVMGLWPI